MTALQIATRSKSHAIGLALVNKAGGMKFVKTFFHKEGNDKAVREFFQILVDAGLYSVSSCEIRISRAEALDLIDDFKKHKGTIAFLKQVGKHGGMIVIMHRKGFPTNFEQASLVQHLLKPEKPKKPKKKTSKKKVKKKPSRVRRGKKPAGLQNKKKK